MDPQTSGGLLAAVDPAAVDVAVATMWWRVGEVAAGDRGNRAALMPPAGRRRQVDSSERDAVGATCAPDTTWSSASTRSAAARGPGR